MNSKTLCVEKPSAKPPKVLVFTSNTEPDGEQQARGKGKGLKAKCPARTVMGASLRSITSSCTLGVNHNESLRLQHEGDGEEHPGGGETDVNSKEIGSLNLIEDVDGSKNSVEAKENEESHEEEADEEEGHEEAINHDESEPKEEESAEQQMGDQEVEVEDDEEEDPEEEAEENLVTGNGVEASSEENCAPPIVLSIRCKNR